MSYFIGFVALNDSVLRQFTPKIYYTIQNIKRYVQLLVETFKVIDTLLGHFCSCYGISHKRCLYSS